MRTAEYRVKIILQTHSTHANEGENLLTKILSCSPDSAGQVSNIPHARCGGTVAGKVRLSDERGDAIKLLYA